MKRFLQKLTLVTSQLCSVNSAKDNGEFPAVQWLRIRLPMPGMWVRSLVLKDLTHHRATKPVYHNS